MTQKYDSQTIIIRRAKHDKEHPYLMLNKNLIRDSSLTVKSRFVLIYLLSFPDDWKFHFDKIAKEMVISRNILYKCLNEIIDKGYGKREILRNEKGQIQDYLYEFSE